jgi:membrane dipeptidase
MDWIDGHLDLAYLAIAGGAGAPPAGRDLRAPCANPAIGCVSLPDLRAGGVSLCFGTIFIEPGKPDEPGGYGGSDDFDGAERAGLRQIEVYEELERAGEIAIVRTSAELDDMTPPPSLREGAGGWVEYSAHSEDSTHPLTPSLKGRGNKDAIAQPIKVIILMEGADPIRSPEHARLWFERGVRIVGLTWAMGTRYAGGNAQPGPLTSAGREMVAALDELGMIHDVSHLSDPAVEELFSISGGPIIASHSNARALLADEPAEAVPGISGGIQRHLPDEFIREIAKRGGVIGLNLYSKFLIGSVRVLAGQRATVSDCIAHIEHIASVMGHRRGIALGSDADGGFPPTMLPEGLDHPSKWEELLDGLSGRGWPKEDIEDFTHKNWLRLLRETLSST